MFVKIAKPSMTYSVLGTNTSDRLWKFIIRGMDEVMITLKYNLILKKKL